MRYMSAVNAKQDGAKGRITAEDLKQMIRTLLRNSLCDRYRSEGDSKPQVFGFLLEPLDLLVLITLLIIFHPLVYVLLAVLEHAIHQPRQVMGHSRDRLRGSEFCAQPFELGTQIGFTAPQAGRGHAQGRGRPVLDVTTPTVIDLAAGNFVVRT